MIKLTKNIVLAYCQCLYIMFNIFLYVIILKYIYIFFLIVVVVVITFLEVKIIDIFLSYGLNVNF